MREFMREARPAALLRIVCGAALIALALFRITATYPVFNQTFDEPYSIACGMQWLDKSEYRYDPKHPPLGRVAAALPLYLSGAHSLGNPDPIVEGNAILRTGDYWHNLTLARMALLPFFIAACAGVWAWANWASASWAAGAWAGPIAVLIFTGIPAILGHAGIAMTDIPLVAMLTWALYLFCLWLDRPSLVHTVWLGIFAGLAALSKLTAFAFLPVCGIAIAAVYGRWRRDLSGAEKPATQPRLRRLALSILIASFVIWAGYRFSLHSYASEKAAFIAQSPYAHPALAAAAEPGGILPKAIYRAKHIPVPAPELLIGLRAFVGHNRNPETNYFLGNVSNRGWLSFYPVVMFAKTPLPVLLLFAIAIVCVLRGDGQARAWSLGAVLICLPCLFAVGLLSHADEGIRHLMIAWSPVAVLSALAVLELFRNGLATRVVAGVLLLGLAIDTARAGPGYLGWFNELVDGSSGMFGVSSDLDYGQDLARLAIESKRLGIESMALAYNGTADPAWFGLPVHRLKPHMPEPGWVAISMRRLKIGEDGDPGAYAWLESAGSFHLIGHSIRLYNIPSTN